MKIDKGIVLHFILLLPIAMTVSIALEVRSWLGATYLTHVFTSNLVQWTGKHFFIGIILSFVFVFVISNLKSKREKIPVFLGLAVAVSWFSQIGYGTTWFCSGFCHDLEPISIPFIFLGTFVSSSISLLLLFFLFKKVPKSVLIFFTILSMVFIAIAVNRTIQQNDILANYAFVIERDDELARLSVKMDRLEKYIADYTEDIVGTKRDEWVGACEKYDKLSYGEVAYGKFAAANCFMKGAILYRDANICRKISGYSGLWGVKEDDCYNSTIPIAEKGSPVFKEQENDLGTRVVIDGVQTAEKLRKAEMLYIRQNYPGSQMRGPTKSVRTVEGNTIEEHSWTAISNTTGEVTGVIVFDVSHNMRELYPNIF